MGLDQTLTITRPGAYTMEYEWRKALAVHRWFVENVQGGDDTSGTYEVLPSELRELRDVLKQVLNNRALGPKLLPTQDGSFLGSTDYGADYLDDAFLALQDVTEVLVHYHPGDRITYTSW
jgi:hypothetical protein